MQQYLPFTVLKLELNFFTNSNIAHVATVLTVYGIETHSALSKLETPRTAYVATVLTVYGIETVPSFEVDVRYSINVATVLTVYGIET